ncbi:MATH and LRR domain-containing protein PFE0570w-like [Mytilus californianus]|uniref:MATH and LRR domain-containing protein PFE0570w-like n=1 Tax=Mytilus californianus TaxID=6549 RepID=UPI002246501F|nr:MATH and LRR domain-containing protein PFE0570w-like [Mytilus californianus]
MEKTACGFCHRGPEVEDICGKLHVQNVKGKKIAAHHKCLQYSAQLVQYKFDSFGGFKIDKVLDEMKRGRYMRCSVCKTSKGKKNKDGFPIGGATAGCALRNCNKTFHYYCAYCSSTAITKRMLIKYKEQNEQVVMYRVFCSPQHEANFRNNKSELFLPFSSNMDSSSEEEEANEDEQSKSGINSSSEEEEDIDEDQEEDIESDTQQNNNAVAQHKDKHFMDVSILTQPSPSLSKPASSNGISSSKCSNSMFTDDDDDDEDDKSEEISNLHLILENDDDEISKPNKVKGAKRHKIVPEVDSPDLTPNKLRVEAEINAVAVGSNSKKATPNLNKKSLPRASFLKDLYENSSDDEIREAPEERPRSSRRCAKNVSYNNSNQLPQSNQRNKRKHSGSDDSIVHKRKTPLKRPCISSDESEDFLSEKEMKSRKKKIKQKTNKTELYDDSPNDTESKDSFLDTQIVLKVQQETSDKLEVNIIDVEDGETSPQPSTSVVRNLTVQLDRLDPATIEKMTPKKDTSSIQKQKVVNTSSLSLKNVRNDGENSKKSETDEKINDKSTVEKQKSVPTGKYLDLGNGASSTESETDQNIYPTCGLILTQDLECSDTQRVELMKQAVHELNIKEDKLAFWLDAFKLEHLQKEIMPHLMNDIGQILCNEGDDQSKIAKLLTSEDKLHSQLPHYSYVLSLYKSMDKSMVKSMQDNVFKQLRINLTNASKKCGCTIGKLLTVQNMNALLLIVNDKLDPRGLIRMKMLPEHTDRLFECKQSTKFNVLNKLPSKLQLDEERSKIVNFVKQEFQRNFSLKVMPSDSIFQVSDERSNVNSIATDLEKSCKDEDTEKQVLCVLPVDKNILNYSPFCKKVLGQFIWQTVENENLRIIGIIDIDQTTPTMDDIISSIVVEEQELNILLAYDPKETPVSCAIVTNIPYKEDKIGVGRKVVAPEVKDSVSTPRQHLPLIKIRKEVTQVIRSSPRKNPN